MRRDVADRVLALATRVLPPAEREWGAAKRAELAGIEPGRRRRRFALGCARALLGRAQQTRATGYPAAGLVLVTVAIGVTAGMTYPPLRWALVGAVGVLLFLPWLARRSWAFGPVGGAPVARVVWLAGVVLVGALVLRTFLRMRSATGNFDEKLGTGIPVLLIIAACYLLGLATLTAGRGLVSGRALVTGAGSGALAAVGWLGIALGSPTLPSSAHFALLCTALAMGAAALANRDRGVQAAAAALGAGLIASLLIFAALGLLAAYAPASMIPDLVPMAITPADQVSNSRAELVDPYMADLMLGAVMAGVLASLRLRNGRWTTGRVGTQPASRG